MKKNEICYPETPRILIIKKGLLQISLYENTKELILYFLHKNNICFCNNTIVIKAKENSEFYFLESHNFLKVFENKDFLNLLLNSLNNNIFIEREILKTLAFHNSFERIIQFLIDASESIGIKTINGIELNLQCTTEEIAEFLGISRQRLSTFINELINLKIIEKKGYKKYIIKNLEQLKNLTSNKFLI